MTKVSDLTALTGAGVDAAADLLPIVDMSLAGTARNKKILVSELKLSFNLGTAADLNIDTDDTLAADSDSLIPTQQAVKAYVDTAVAGAGGAIEVLDEGVSETAALVSLDFVGAGVVASDDGSGNVTVTISSGGAGIDVEDEGVSEATGATTLNFTGAGVTATDAGGGVVDVAIPGASGTGWALAGTGQTATGVYDFAVDGAKANIDFVGLASFNELLIFVDGLAWGTSGSRQVRVSTDNGSTFYSSSGDYVQYDSSGVSSNQTVLAAHGTATTAARSMTTHLINTKGALKSALSHGSGNIVFKASASDINAVRVTSSGGGNSSAGVVRILGR